MSLHGSRNMNKSIKIKFYLASDAKKYSAAWSSPNGVNSALNNNTYFYAPSTQRIFFIICLLSTYKFCSLLIYKEKVDRLLLLQKRSVWFESKSTKSSDFVKKCYLLINNAKSSICCFFKGLLPGAVSPQYRQIHSPAPGILAIQETRDAQNNKDHLFYCI